MNDNIRKVLSITLTAAMMAGCIAGCSEDLGPETLPSTTESTEETTESTTEETTEATTETAETTIARIPSSTIRVDKPVEVNGQLKIDGANIVNKDGKPYQLRGISSYYINECGDLFTDDIISTLGYDWGCDVVRLAYNGNTNEDPEYAKAEEEYFNKICQITDALIEQGLYVIIDWQMREDGDPMQNKDAAVDFFSRISAIYGDKENILYEIASNPQGEFFDDPSSPVDWARIKKYAKAVTAAIRENDPDNIIICGTRDNCQEIGETAESPLKGDNICYALHFYGGYGDQDHIYFEEIEAFRKKGLCIFVTEFYPTSDQESNMLNLDDIKNWLDFLDKKNISWVSWPIGSNGAVVYDALNPMDDVFTSEERSKGHWADPDISTSGEFIRDRLVSYFKSAEE